MAANGTITRITLGDYTKEIEGDYTIYTENFTMISGGEGYFSSDEEILYGDAPEDAPPQAGVEVKKIEMVSDLDEGSPNDGTDIPKLGLVYGKKYKLRVTKFKDDIEPDDEDDIKWGYGYSTELEDGTISVVIGVLKQTGRKIKFKAKELEMCGRDITFYAYIQNKPDGASLDVFHHYRFRWLDRQQITLEVALRISLINGTDQGGSSLCGIAVVAYFLTKYQPQVYENFVLDMHRKGVAIIKSNSFKIEIDSDEHLIKYKQSDKEFPERSMDTKKMALSDFVFLVTVKDSLNDFLDYDPDGPGVGDVFWEGTAGLTLPHEVASVMKNLANYQDVINDTNLITSRWRSPSYWISKLKERLIQGYKIALLIESDNFKKNKKSDFTFPTHWVALLDISENVSKNEVTLTVFTWDSITVWTVSHDVFKDGYFGYMGGK